jgi:hypothetical protein
MKMLSLLRAAVLSLLITALAFSLGGCAQVHEVGEPRHADRPAPGKGLVIFYRENHPLSSATDYRVKDGFASIGGLRNGSYFAYQADPGRHFFQATTEITEQVILDVEAGRTYYVRGSVRPGVVLLRPKLEMAPREVGAEAIRGLRRMEKTAHAKPKWRGKY